MFSDQLPFIIQVLVLGLAQGAIYALIALGYTMVYGIIELINFAHGDVFMIGTFVTVIVFTLLGATHTIDNNWPLLIGVLLITALVAMVFCGLLGVVIERVAYRPLRNAPRLAPLITAIGISLILEDLAKLRFGSSFVGVPSVFPNVTFKIGQVTISWLNVITFLVAVALMVALQILISRTRTGRAMRSVAQDRDAASLMGVDVDRTIVITFFLGGALAGAAGLIWGLELKQTVFYVGFQVGLIAFTAAVLGGIGNIVGAMLGGLIIGLVPATIQILDFYFPGYQLTRWNEAAIFAVLILILVFRPTGLLGQQTPDKV
ncbi:MAG TPA: branched-chain amino acid ABC transporter permease [Ktedonobacterales bacterium]|jgi:branched-chain amino acid transport system permease protein|nr:branched-chain amino acid ABC transporter permease [Ktedonobacterales bacterium]